MKYYLQHYGILGQKWGVRRFQNPDGTLTEEGKKRYLNSDGSYTDEGKRHLAENLAKNLSKNHYSSGQSLHEKFQNKTLDPVLQAIPKSAIKDVSAARDRMLSIMKANSYDADSFDNEVYESLEKNWDHYSKQAKIEFKKREGYDPGDGDGLWLEAYDLAEQDALKRHPDIKKKENEMFKAANEYQSYCEKVSESILGEYGNIKVPSKNSWDQSTVNNAINDCFYLIDLHPELREFLLNGSVKIQNGRVER